MCYLLPRNPTLGCLVLRDPPFPLASSMATAERRANLVCSRGDPLRPLLFSLVLQKLAASIDADEECIDLLFHAWYLDDGVLAGNRLAVSRAFFLIQEWAQLLVSTLTWGSVNCLPVEATLCFLLRNTAAQLSYIGSPGG